MVLIYKKHEICASCKMSIEIEQDGCLCMYCEDLVKESYRDGKNSEDGIGNER